MVFLYYTICKIQIVIINLSKKYNKIILLFDKWLFGAYNKTMEQFSAQPVSATFHLGSQITLTPNWKDKNVILPNSKLFYILDGEIVINTDKCSFIAKKGDMVLIPAGVKHDFHLSPLNYAKKCWIHFDLNVGTNSLFENIDLPYKITVGKNSFVKKLFDQVFLCALSPLPQEKLKVSSGIIDLVSFYLEHCDYEQKSKQFKDEIDSAIEFIKNNYDKNLTLSDVAKHANLSPNYFVRKFKERTGYAPLQFACIMKMERAKYLIEQTEDSISSIMEQLGFYDASYFCKLFKKYCGYSPKKFREISGNRSN